MSEDFDEVKKLGSGGGGQVFLVKNKKDQLKTVNLDPKDVIDYIKKTNDILKVEK